MATGKLEIYKCNVCGIVTEVLDGGAGDLVCCGEPMRRMAENTVDAAKEKHIPVVEDADEGVKVKVGSVPHPMEQKHFIEWIEVVSGGKAYRHFLEPGQSPESVFKIESGQIDYVREYCNIHGLWKA
jgi:superoxide reductase